MLHLLDASLERFFRDVLPLPERDVEISFEAPDREWGASVNKPTLNLYLWDVRRNVEEVHSGMEVVDAGDGKRVRRPPKPRIDCRYLISAWTSEVRDEHGLLGSVLAAILPRSELGADYLEGAYAAVRPLPSLRVGTASDQDKSDFWSALGGQLKPGVDLLVTATVDSTVVAEAGPAVDRYRIGIDGRGGGGRSERNAVGGTAEPPGSLVRSPRGVTTVGPDGTFLVVAETGDEVVVEGDSPRRGKVRAKGALDLKAKRRG